LRSWVKRWSLKKSGLGLEKVVLVLKKIGGLGLATSLLSAKLFASAKISY